MSPRTNKQLDEIREQRRNDILEAALELFASQGYHNTSIEAIRKKAGVSKGLIYNYFDKKEDLVTGIMMAEVNQGDHFFEQIVNASNSHERIHMLIEFSFQSMRQNRDHHKLMIGLSLQLDLPEFSHLTDLIKGRYANLQPYAESLMKDMGYENAWGEAMELMATLDGIAFQYLILGEAVDLQRFKTFLINKYCKPPQNVSHE